MPLPILIEVVKYQGLMKLSTQDHEKLSELGIPQTEVLQQYQSLQRGPAYLSLVAPCTAAHGIRIINPEDQQAFAKLYSLAQEYLKITKFVPASGAATRMFQPLIQQVQSPHNSELNLESKEFFNNLTRFPFWPPLKKYLSKIHESADDLVIQKKYQYLLQTMLDSPGLDLANRPKGLVEFHRYDSELRTAFIEHLYEGRNYLEGKQGRVHMHFTVPLHHQEAFQTAWALLQRACPEEFRGFDTQFSIQDARTHTVALDSTGSLLRDADNDLILRPGGHGALLNNLATLNEDLIFIKNIDNVARQENHNAIGQMQKVLGGVLLDCQRQIFDWMQKVQSHSLNDSQILELDGFLLQTLGVSGFKEALKKQEAYWKPWIQSKLMRPLRVCGMVRHSGEPGGGPFWVRMPDGNLSKQIVEASQVDPKDSDQQKIFAAATHFNPVNLVCSFKDQKGEVYFLREYCDSDAYFTAQKAIGGKPAQILERPGLWNGAMAFWNTVFVEVPQETFCPVKSVLDLLRPEHQGVGV